MPLCRGGCRRPVPPQLTRLLVPGGGSEGQSKGQCCKCLRVRPIVGLLRPVGGAREMRSEGQHECNASSAHTTI
eukprot:14243863-Alexandrium_andersonii.AAC.1